MQKSDSLDGPLDGPYYSCPICGKIIRYVIHPSMGEAWSRGRVRGEHLRSHNIDHHFISPARKDDPVFIKTLFKWNQKMAKGKRKAPARPDFLDFLPFTNNNAGV